MTNTGSRAGPIGAVALYQHAVRRLLEVRERLQHMLTTIARAAEMLEGDGWKAAFAAQSSAAMTPLKAISEHRVDLANLPSGKDLMAAFGEWSAAWEALNKVWLSLPQHCQVGLKEPKELY